MTRSDAEPMAQAHAARGWPVFPCRPGTKEPATAHGFHDAATDPDLIAWWWRRHPDANVAIATGAPGPDVLDVDNHGQAGNGFAALNRLVRAGLTDSAMTVVATPSGGAHFYFAGSEQRSGKLTRHHLDFKAAGGYIVAPPSQVNGKLYRAVRNHAEAGGLNWGQVVCLLEPSPAATARPGRAVRGDLAHLPAWVARQQQGNRNDSLFWAACRAAEAGDSAVLAELAVAARAAGLPDPEIHRTIASARQTAGLRSPEQHAEPECAP